MTEQDFTRIVSETKAVVLSAVEKHLDSRFYHAIDDVVQETYIRAYRNLIKGGFREEAAISSWLFAIARNESRRMNMKLGREEEKARKKAGEVMKGTDNRGNPRTDDDIHDLKKAIEKLPLKYRSVMELAMEGMSVSDIAGALDIREGTVKSRTSRGKEMLQKIMQGGRP